MGAGNQKQQKIALSGEIDHTAIKDKSFNDKYIMTPIEIGRGANAIVMMATCKTNNKVVVVKKIKNDKTERSRQMIKKECEISMALKHPHILEFYDYFENEDETYLVCEYCQGGELYDLIRDTKIRTKRGISEELARQYLAQIISAVEYMHCNMIAHRDLKPENILLDKDKKCIKVCDFGMAAIVNSENYVNRRYSCCGSPGYFAPEIMKDFYQPLISEVWSLGVVLYSMLAGEMPFGSGEQYMAKMRDEQAQYLVPAYFSSEVKNLLAKMLVFNPSARISLSKVKEHAWMMGSALPHKKYPALKLVEVWKLKYMAHLGYDVDEIYKAVIENKRDSMFVTMYHNLKQSHVPEALRARFNMMNSDVSGDLKKMDKKSRSDPQYSSKRSSMASVGYSDKNDSKLDTKLDNKLDNKLDIKLDIKLDNKTNIKHNSNLETKNKIESTFEKNPNMKSSLVNFSLAKPINELKNELKDEPQKTTTIIGKNHSFLDNIYNFAVESPDNLDDSSETELEKSKRTSIISAEVFTDVTSNETKNNKRGGGSPIANKLSPVCGAGTKRASSPLMMSVLLPPDMFCEKTEEKPVNDSPNRFQRFESVTRRASDIFRSKKKPTEDTDVKISSSVDSARVYVPPIDKLSQNQQIK